MIKIRNRIFLGLLFVFIVSCQSHPEDQEATYAPKKFDSSRAYQDLAYQVSLGPRTIGSQAHSTVVEWIYSEMSKSGWDVELQVGKWNESDITNIIGKRGEGSPWIIIGAHYDSRFYADRDLNLEKRQLPVLGANDGASGVSVLTELARDFPAGINKQIWLVFFDAEDNGDITGWDWSVGSRIFVNQLVGEPDAVVIIDMIGDSGLEIYKEKNSDPQLTDQLWSIASNLGYTQFIDEYNHSLIDDHIPFLEKEIPATLIIDFDYPYWHTSEDNLDKVSPQSLSAVGNVLLAWLQHEP